jgi:hypothetical protein
MKIIVNTIIPFKGFAAINLFGVLFVRKGVTVSKRMIRHESIHTQQMRELMYIPFYLWYFAEWLCRLFSKGKQAYYNISFEREAYDNEGDVEYLNTRRYFAFLKYIGV